jgi:glycosyltransferase involved in cell wall biosynthesis
MAEVVPTRLVTFADKPFRERVGNLEVIAVGPPWYIRGQRGSPLHSGLVRQIGWANVVHCHQRYVFANSLAAALCRVSGRRVFVSDLGGGGWDISGRVPAVGRLYHGFLHISQYSRQIAGQDHIENATVVYGGADIVKFSPDPTVRKEALVLYVGRLLPHKGINYLVEALPEGLSLELIGGLYNEDFHTELKRLAAGKRVVFRHECDDVELVRAYRRAACVVLPSVYRTMYGLESKVPELLGQTLLEGMACGIPAVCTAVASMPEIVADGVTGFVVPPNDSAGLRARLEWIRDHPAEAQCMGQAGRQRVLEHFAWPAVVRCCLSAYGGHNADVLSLPIPHPN